MDPGAKQHSKSNRFVALKIAIFYFLVAAVLLYGFENFIRFFLQKEHFYTDVLILENGFFLLIIFLFVYGLSRYFLLKNELGNSAVFSDILLKNILEHTGEGMVISDINNKIIAVNRTFTELMGYSESEICGKEGSFLRSGRHDDAFYKNIWDTVNSKGFWQGEMWVRRKNGEIFPEWLNFSAVKNIKNKTTHYLAIFSDVTERKTSADRIQFLSHFDPLTNLPNRSKLHDDLEIFLTIAKKKKNRIVIAYIDLDRFKNINASYGLITGDQLLQAVAKRLQAGLQSGEIVGHISGDKFVVIVSDIKNTEEIAHISLRFMKLMQAPFNIEDNNFTITVSIGISVYPDDGTNANILIKNAETAMYRAKKNGRNNYQFFTPDMNLAAVEYINLENKLREGLKNNQFKLVYHPLINLKTKQICGVEALTRWPQKDETMVPPVKFIPIAEESGLIIPLTEWILQTACEDNLEWLAAGLPPTPIAINISSFHFHQKNFKSTIENILQKTGLDPSNLKLELTEGVIMQDSAETIKTLLELKEIGLRFSIDDFGTGYSSLSYLKRFPIDQLKIDQSFVRDVVNNTEDQAIIRAIINLAKSLNLITIAEGVETKEQLKFLREEGCDVIQGYYFSKPVSKEDIMKMLKEKLELQD